MTMVKRKIVTSKEVWAAYVNGVKNDLTADDVATSLGMRIGSYRQAINKLKSDFIKANPDGNFPKLRRNTKSGSKVDPMQMVQDLQVLTQD